LPGHVACAGENLVEKPEGKRQLGRPTGTLEDAIKLDLKEIGSTLGLDFVA
jgi:hypothetical protein